MEIGYVREFVTLAAAGNFIEASEQLFISQSTLSRHLQALEAEIGVPLFDRTTRKVEINDYGKLFLPYAHAMLDAHDGFVHTLGEKLHNLEDELIVGSIPSMAQYRITNVIAGFQAENPSYKLRITEAESRDLKNSLRQGTCDLAFVREKPDEKSEFMVIPYTEDRLAAVLPNSHPLAACESVALSQLKDENFMLLPEKSMMHSLCVTACRAAGFEPRVGFIGSRAENIIDLVSKGMGISLLTKKPALHLVPADVSVVDIAPKISTRINIIYPKDKQPSIAVNMFVKYVKTLRLSTEK